MAGNFILSQAVQALASVDNSVVIEMLSNVLEDLVQGMGITTRLMYIRCDILHYFMLHDIMARVV